MVRRIVDRYHQSRIRLDTDRALLLFAKAYTAVGAMDSAQWAFEAAIAETERRRSSIASAEDRARFLDQTRPSSIASSASLVARSDTLGALQFLERMRSQVLLEHVLKRSPNATRSAVSIDSLRLGCRWGSTW